MHIRLTRISGGPIRTQIDSAEWKSLEPFTPEISINFPVTKPRGSGILVRIWAIFAKRALDAELEAELNVHLALAIVDYMARGKSRKEGRRLALIQFVGVQQAG